jgi:hypothetical protein
MYKILLGAVLALLLSNGGAMAACTTLTSFTNGQTADATQVMNNFNAINNCAAPLITPSFTTGIQIDGVTSSYAQANIISHGGVGNGYAALFKLTNANGQVTQFLLADSGAGTPTYYSEYPMAVLSTQSGYGIKINTNGTDNNGLRIATSGATTCYPTCSNASDLRLKKDIAALTSAQGLTAINALRPVSYKWKDATMGAEQQIGLIAQDVRRVFPQVVMNSGAITKGAPDGILALNYSALTAPIVLAIQQLDARTKFVTAAGGAAPYDRRQQANIREFSSDALAIVKGLRPVSFTWQNATEIAARGPQFGFVAQEVRLVAPELVFSQGDKAETLAMKPNSLIPILTKAIQQQQDAIAALKAANDNQAVENTRLEAQLLALQRKVANQTAQR